MQCLQGFKQSGQLKEGTAMYKRAQRALDFIAGAPAGGPPAAAAKKKKKKVKVAL